MNVMLLLRQPSPLLMPDVVRNSIHPICEHWSLQTTRCWVNYILSGEFFWHLIIQLKGTCLIVTVVTGQQLNRGILWSDGGWWQLNKCFTALQWLWQKNLCVFTEHRCLSWWVKWTCLILFKSENTCHYFSKANACCSASNLGPSSRITARVYRGSSTAPVIQHLQKAVLR